MSWAVSTHVLWEGFPLPTVTPLRAKQSNQRQSTAGNQENENVWNVSNLNTMGICF